MFWAFFISPFLSSDVIPEKENLDKIALARFTSYLI